MGAGLGLGLEPLVLTPTSWHFTWSPASNRLPSYLLASLRARPQPVSQHPPTHLTYKLRVTLDSLRPLTAHILLVSKSSRCYPVSIPPVQPHCSGLSASLLSSHFYTLKSPSGLLTGFFPFALLTDARVSFLKSKADWIISRA